MKKLVSIFAIITLIVSLLIVTANAAELTFSATMKPSSTTVAKGEECTVTLSVSNLSSAGKGINSVSGYLTVDDKVFEKVSADNFEGLNDWSVSQYNEETGMVVLMRTSFVNKTQDICQVTLKTKSSATATRGNVEFKTIVASNSEDELTAQDISLGINVGKASSGGTNSVKLNTSNSNTNTSGTRNLSKNTSNNASNTENTNTNTGNSSKPINSSNTSNKATNNTANKVANVSNQTTDKDEMPDTGIDDTIVKAIILVSIIGALGYIKFRSLNK